MGAMSDTTTPGQPRDEHSKALKQSVSHVKQLRGWMASDPTRTEEFVDALNQVTGLRLLSRAWAEAAPEATEAVTASDRLVASRGPVGAYTPAVDAGRYFTALTHVATIQSGMRLSQPAGNTIAAAFAWKDQLTGTGLEGELLPRTIVWALLARAEGALADGDLAGANAWADAALTHARATGLDGDQTPVLLAALRLDADARYAVGLTDQSVDLLQQANQAWEQWTGRDLAQLPRMAKAHLEREMALVTPIRRDLADRLDELGRHDEAQQVREQLGTLLHRSAMRRGEPGRTDEALGRADQAWALADRGDTHAALRAAEEAHSALQGLLKQEKPVGSALPTQALVASSVARAELRAGRTDQALRTLSSLFSRLQAHPGIAVSPAARALALCVRAEAHEAAGDPAAATADRAEAEQVVGQLRAHEEHLYGHLDATSYLRARARGVQPRSGQPTPHWQVPDVHRAFAPDAEPVEAATISDEEAMRRIDEQREQEARERAVAELQAAAQRAQHERETTEARKAALARIEAEEAERRRVEADQAERQRVEAEQEAARREQAEREAAELADQQRRQEAEAAAARQAQEQQEAAERARQEESARAESERLEAERVERERLAAAQEAAAQAAEQARQQEQQAAEEAARRDQERRAQEAAEQERREREQAEAARREAEQRELERLEAERREREQQEREQAEAERQRAEAERQERERLERERAEREEQQRQQAEAEQRAAEEREAREQAEQERIAQEKAEQERLDKERERLELEARAAADLATEQAAAQPPVQTLDPLERLRTEAHRALASGDKQRIISTHEALIAQLEPGAAADPQGRGRELVEALERLSDAQGWLRGRSAGRQAKQLAKDFGLR